ncbi:hypothetical protein GCM10027431_19630 [Lysobacter rhizosphaerae]
MTSLRGWHDDGERFRRGQQELARVNASMGDVNQESPNGRLRPCQESLRRKQQSGPEPASRVWCRAPGKGSCGHAERAAARVCGEPLDGTQKMSKDSSAGTASCGP